MRGKTGRAKSQVIRRNLLSNLVHRHPANALFKLPVLLFELSNLSLQRSDVRAVASHRLLQRADLRAHFFSGYSGDFNFEGGCDIHLPIIYDRICRGFQPIVAMVSSRLRCGLLLPFWLELIGNQQEASKRRVLVKVSGL